MSSFDPPPDFDPDDAQRFLFDETIERAALIERLKSGLSIAVLRAWRPFERGIINRARNALSRIRGRGVGALSQRGIQNHLARQREAIEQASRAVESLVRRDLREFADLQAEWQVAVLGETLPTIQFGVIPESVKNQIANSRPFNGRTLNEAIGQVDEATKRIVTEQTRLAVINGESGEQLARRLRPSRTGGALNRTRTELETISQTAIQQVANEIQQETLSGFLDVFRQEIWVATLDRSTCPTCASLDGQIYNFGEGPQWPIHPRCRCRRVPVIPGASFVSRASSGGQVRGDLKFGDWLLTQPDSVQNRVLGKTRADLFRSGQLDGLDPMLLLGPEFRPVRLPELNRRLIQRSRR